ncbi:hypothetical protein, partial [Rhizobium leguminosarum]|uniref:hypothetical protein n=1 Tax=Rhizobium leguminosarum TaxID=384 RepID=UPI003F9CBBD0
RMLGKDELVQKLATCNFQQVKKDQTKLGLSMILGGCGATLEELTGLYSVFANGGKYVRPAFTLDPESPIRKGESEIRITSTAATYMINETLS